MKGVHMEGEGELMEIDGICVNLVKEISSKGRQGGGGLDLQTFCGCPLRMPMVPWEEKGMAEQRMAWPWPPCPPHPLSLSLSLSLFVLDE